MDTLGDLHWRIEKYEGVITDHEDTATKQIEDIFSSTQPEIDVARDTIRRQEALIARIEADREARKADILSIASRVTGPTRLLLANAKHQLAAVSAPILRLPTECIAEIMMYFNVDNPTLVLLLVSKRWNAIATATPQLWSKIVLSGNCHPEFRLKEGHICKSLEHLSFVLSLAKNVPLDIELACLEPFGFPRQNFSLPLQLQHQMLAVSQNPGISGDRMMGPLEPDCDWRDMALRLLGADGQCRRWRSLYITSWYNVDLAPFTVINGPFDNLRSLYILPLSGMYTAAYESLVASIIQEAPRLSTVNTKDFLIVQRVQGWKDRRFWRKIESYHSLAGIDDWSFLSHASRLSDLSLCSWHTVPQGEPVFLPSLRTLRLIESFPEALGGFRIPALETIFLDGSNIFARIDDAIPVLSVTSIISTNLTDVRILRRIFAPSLYHLYILCLDFVDRRPRSKAWQSTFTETFDGSRFMPRPISLHLELPISEYQLLSALHHLPQIEELRILPLHPLGTKFWTALTPRGVGGRKKAKQYCTKLRILVVEIKMRPHGTGQALTKARTMELGIEMSLAREQEGQPLTHLLFSWDDGSKDEVLGSFSTLPLYPLPEPPINSAQQYGFY